MDRKYQVFISSTFRDLQTERRIVIEQVLNISHIPVGMEAFQAADESQWNYIKKRILECDYYVVIVAERYGSEGIEGKSFTQMEYEFAIQNNIPTLAFLLHEDSRKIWPKEKVEFEKSIKIEKFRKLCETKLCRHWINADDLGGKVATSLLKLFIEKPRIGWIRGNEAIQSEATNELINLSKEKRKLEIEIDLLKNNSINLKPREIARKLRNIYYKIHENKEAGRIIITNQNAEDKVSLAYILGKVIKGMGTTAKYDYIYNKIKVIPESIYEGSNIKRSISNNDIENAINSLVFYGLILELNSKNYGVTSLLKLNRKTKDRIFYLTELGRNVIITLED